MQHHDHDSRFQLTRRSLLRDALIAAAAGRALAAAPTIAAPVDAPLSIVDVNVHLFQWPSRRLPGDELAEHVAALREHGVTEAWAGSFESILHRDLAGVNERLASACAAAPRGLLVPFGAVHPGLPDWEEDVRRCHERHRMPGLRLLPAEHGYGLNDPRFARLLQCAAERELLVQLAVSLEDPRTQHPRLRTADVDLRPLPELLQRIPRARVMLLNHRLRGERLAALASVPNLYFDTARSEGTDGVARLLDDAALERICFGSHFPFLIHRAGLIRLGESALSDEDCRAILSGNARRLLPAALPRPDHNGHLHPAPAARPAALSRRTDRLGLPPADELARYNIWDSYFWPSSARLLEEIEETLPVADRFGIRRLCVALHAGLGTASGEEEQRLQAQPEQIDAALRRWPDRLLGFLQLNAHDVPGSLRAIDRWLANGPMLGVYFPGGRLGALACDHPHFDPLIERVTELGGLVVQHTWLATGGKQAPGTSTPQELALLAARHPRQSFLCAHAGGEWEQGLRAVRALPNVLVETSGFDPTAGFLEMAVRELGTERIVFGSHLPSRSLGTELGKALAAPLDDAGRAQILGGNLRRLLLPLMRRKRLV